MPVPTPEAPPEPGPTSVLCENAALRDAWYAVARVADVTIHPVPVTLLGTKVVLYLAAGGEIVAAPDRCPHREAPLTKGHVKDGCLVCPYHGWTFGDGGTCVRVPSSSDDAPPPRAHLPTHVAQQYGLVWLCLGTPAHELPVIPQDDDPTFRRLNTPVEVWRTCAARMSDNFLDITHFPWVHLGTFGIAQDTRVPRFELGELDHGWYGYSYEVRALNNAASTTVSGQGGTVVERKMSSGFHLPFDVRSTIEYHTGLQHILLLLSTPIDDVTSYFTFVVWRNDDFTVPSDEVLRFDMAIGAEDKFMLEQVPGVMPLDQTTLVSVQADKCGVEWRRRLVELMRSS
ncbi:MAG: Rieske 2Fe-2S domain-containing protein [Acidimicrobiaceae bacterium]|nr:Rieske 2Fe-2S domain-containing protein [Acidimicrobiaceae bacterium]